MKYLLALAGDHMRLWFFGFPAHIGFISRKHIGSYIVPCALFATVNGLWTWQRYGTNTFGWLAYFLEAALYLFVCPPLYGVRLAMITTVACCLSLLLGVHSNWSSVIGGWQTIAMAHALLFRGVADDETLR